MAKRKRKTTAKRASARRKSRAEERMPAGLGTLFVGLLLIVLAFVEGDSVWKSAHQILFGLFGCGSFVLGAAVCYLAILYTRGQDLLMQVFKLLLGLIFASGTVIVFSFSYLRQVYLRHRRIRLQQLPQSLFLCLHCRLRPRRIQQRRQ